MALPDCMMPDGAEPCGAYRALQAELARVREELAKQERLSVDIVNGHRAVVERVARRAHSIWVADPDGMMIDEAVAQAMREEA